MDDFKVETKGFCFLCLNKIEAKLFPLSESLSSSCSVHSLHSLTRYLKLDMRKVFDEEGHVPHELLEKVKGARLKVELCGECASLNKTFLKLYRQLERMEMEVKSCINRIHGKLSVENKIGQLLTLPNPNANDGVESFNGKLKIAEVLRNEAKQKCLSKVKDGALPRIKLRNWSMNQVKKERCKVKYTVYSQRQNLSVGGGGKEVFGGTLSHGASTTVKQEVREEHSSSHLLQDDDTGSDHFGDDDYIECENENSELSTLFKAAITSSKSTINKGAAVATASNSFTDTDSTTVAAALQFEKEDSSYKCKVCGKRFGSKGNWQAHYKGIHLGIKYKCNLCGMEFNVKTNYSRHHRSVHVGVKFKCLVCNKAFTQKLALARHQRTSSCKTGNRQN